MNYSVKCDVPSPSGRACNRPVGHMGSHEVRSDAGLHEAWPKDYTPNVWHNWDPAKEKRPQPEETVLDEAKGLVYGDREEEYSHPAVDFERIARFWRAYFQAQGQGAVNIGAEDVAKLMILLKISRLTNSYHHDSVVDIAGYALCLARLEEK